LVFIPQEFHLPIQEEKDHFTRNLMGIDSHDILSSNRE
jgi:hypothetical protein